MQTKLLDNTFALSDFQQAAWFLYKLSPEGYGDKCALAIRFNSNIDINLLEVGFRSIVESHPSLRSRYFQDKGLVEEVGLSRVDVIDAWGWCGEELQQGLDRSIQQSFDLEAGSVIRMSLFRVSPTNQVLVVVGHLIACDDLSLLGLVDELLGWCGNKPQKIYKTQTTQKSLADLKGFWEGQLAGELPLLGLPGYKLSPVLGSYKGASLNWVLDESLKEKLQAIAVACNVNLTVVFLTAFYVLLYRYTGESDILIAWQQDLRNNTKTIGYFTNFLPLRVGFCDDLGFQELCSRVNLVLDNAIAHQDYPFPCLVRDFKSPICQVGFAYQNLNEFELLPNLFIADAGVEFFELSQQRVEFDFNLDVFFVNNSIIFKFKYNTDLLDAAIVNSMVEHYRNLLVSIAQNSQDRVSRLPLLSGKERQQILFDWNRTAKDYDLSLCLHELVTQQVEKTPDAIAVKFKDEELTYRELNSRANQLAHYLQFLGVQPEELVGICVNRSLEMVVGLLGILKAGGAYVPIDPGYPQERIAYMLEDSQVTVLLTQYSLLSNLPMHPVYTIALDRDWSKIEESDDSEIRSEVTCDNLAYVIYTSGSTGKPKGALNTHRGICNRLLWMQEEYNLTSDDCVLQKTPFSFDVSVWELFWPLITGAKLVVAEPGGHRDSFYLIEIIINEAITTLHFVPSMLQVFLETKGVELCKSLTRVICSGEALPVDLQKRFFQRLNCQLHNLYGPTEAAIDVTYWQCQPNTTLPTVPIGRPIANTQIYILDNYQQPVPVGVIGELYIGGFGVGRGYWNRLELSHQKFIPNPFATGRMYKTGDLGRFLGDGSIEYVGRIDHQVKIRGFRIELGEIENVLIQHPDVREAVVIALNDHRQNKHLIAYLVFFKSQIIQSELRYFLKEKLPEFMMPSAFIILEAMPLTPNGKIDRRALAISDFAVSDRSNLFVSARNDLERQLVRIWSELLHVSEIGVCDNFFEIGGNSLLAIHLVSAIAEKFGHEIPLATLFSNPTIEQLAEILQNSSHIFSNSSQLCTQKYPPYHYSPLVAIQAKGDKSPFFCVHPAGGHVLCYFQLARYLGTDQPFYGLQAQGFYGDEEPLTTVNEMASLYVEAIKSVQLKGPYQIGGWSFGGVVAYEVAQQLQQQGDEVSLLAILDSYVPIILDKTKKIDNKYLVGVLSRVFGGMFGKDNLVVPEEIVNLSIEEQLDYIIDKARIAKIFPPGVERQNNRRILDVLVGTLKATYSYQRQPYPGKVTVFRAQAKHIMAPDPTMVWVELFSILDANEVEVCDVPGNHYSFVLEPYVQVLAERLKDKIDSN